MNPVQSVGIVAFDSNGRILLVREEEGSSHLTGMYGLPAGRVEPNEANTETAAREFTEETGLTADKKDFLEFPDNFFIADIPRKDGTIKTFHHTVFLVRKFTGEIKPGLDTTAGWYSYEDVEKLDSEVKLLSNVLKAIDNTRS